MYQKIFIFIVSFFAIAKLDAQQLHFVQAIAYLDTLIEGERTPIFFPFENTTNDTCTIIHVKSSCGCTGAFLARTKIPPHTKDTLFATYETIGHLGNIHTEISLTDDKKNRYSLQLGGFVKAFSPIVTIYFSPVAKNDFVKYSDTAISIYTDSITTAQQYVLLVKNIANKTINCEWNLPDKISAMQQHSQNNNFSNIHLIKKIILEPQDALLFFAKGNQLNIQKNTITIDDKKVVINIFKKATKSIF